MTVGHAVVGLEVLGTLVLGDRRLRQDPLLRDLLAGVDYPVMKGEDEMSFLRKWEETGLNGLAPVCLLYTSPSPRD